MSSSGTRKEEQYRGTASTDGTYSPKINKTTAERLHRYCKMLNIKKVKYVEDCINKCLDIDEIALLESKTKEELIAMVLGRTK